MTQGPGDSEMSDPGDFGPGTPERDDALAAEYVMGLLDLPERMEFETRLKSQHILRHRVEAWQARLAPLNEAYPEVPPPDLMPAIEARLFGAAARRRGLRFWGGWLSGAVAAVALLAAALTQLAPPGPVRDLGTTLAAAEGGLVLVASYDIARGTLDVQRSAGAPAAAGQDYQLWLIDASGVPVSLGLLRGEGTMAQVPDLVAGVTLAVSLEPEGGSPTGLPTGPVLATGIVTDL